MAAFLRVVNAAENIRQVRKRALFVRDNRSSGNTASWIAIADVDDAIDVLVARDLNRAAQNILRDVELTLQTARANADANRPPFMDHALTFLGLAKADIADRRSHRRVLTGAPACSRLRRTPRRR